MSDDDLIRRGDALAAINNLDVFSAHESASRTAKAVSVIHKAMKAIAALPAAQPAPVSLELATIAERDMWRDRAQKAEAQLAAQPAPVTVEEAVRVLLANADDVWTPEASTATDKARSAARRAGHKYRVIDREGFKAALRALAGDKP